MTQMVTRCSIRLQTFCKTSLTESHLILRLEGEDVIEFDDGSELVIRKLDGQLFFVMAEEGIAEEMVPVLVLEDDYGTEDE